MTTMTRTLQPEPVWWCYQDGAEVVSDERPACPKNEDHRMVSIGWRVGYNSATYCWYSTPQAAATDKRLKK